MSLGPLTFRHVVWDWSRAYVAGVINVTPDSFSGDGIDGDIERAVSQGTSMAAAGADLLDVGGASTRPGSEPVDPSVELARVEPVIRRLAALVEVPISIDTTSAVVAKAALEAGAEVVNDISGGLFDPGLPVVAAEGSAVYICGHLRGSSIGEVHAREDESPGFGDVVRELRLRMAALPAILAPRTIVDPGLGFGKGIESNLELSKRAGDLRAALQCRVMLGPSRKRFVAAGSGVPRPGNDVRDMATVGVSLASVAAGADILRVHNVAALVPALRMFEAVRGAGR